MSSLRDFELSIKRVHISTTKVLYKACVTYIGANTNLINSLKSILKEAGEEDNCVFKLIFQIEDTYDEGSFKLGQYDEDEYDEIDWYYKSDAHLYKFYNNALRAGLRSQEMSKLKGIGHALLCIILQDAIKNGLLQYNSMLSLEASGSIKGVQDMTGLVEYYERLGFYVTNPNIRAIGIYEGFVPMMSSVKDVINICKTTEYSDSVKNIIENFNIQGFNVK